MSTPNQRTAKRCALAAVGTVVLAAYVTVSMPPWSATTAVAVHFIWGYCLIALGLWLPLQMLVRGLQRYRDEAQITGEAPLPGSREAIDARVLQNTLEQTVFAVIATGLLTLSQAHHASMLLLVHAWLFTIGRIWFWIAYHRAPVMRIYGFGIGAYSTLGIFIYAASFLLRALEV